MTVPKIKHIVVHIEVQ